MKVPADVVLPTKNGVGPSCIVLPPGSWPRVIDFLAERFDTIPRSEIEARILRGDVVDAAGGRIAPGHPYQPHLKLYYYRSIETEVRIPFDEVILFEDEYIVVADKPHFLPVTPGGRYLQETLLVRLKRRLGLDSLAPMHRIDRETAGLVLFTKQPHTRGRYQELFARRDVVKRYQAIARWRADLPLPMTYRSRLEGADHFMRMREADGAPNAETGIELMDVRGELARYRLLPATGKKHQLRVHMAALGMPILHDQIYPDHLTKAQIELDDFSKPLQLLAEYVALHDPVTGETRQFETGMRLRAL